MGDFNINLIRNQSHNLILISTSEVVDMILFQTFNNTTK